MNKEINKVITKISVKELLNENNCMYLSVKVTAYDDLDDWTEVDEIKVLSDEDTSTTYLAYCDGHLYACDNVSDKTNMTPQSKAGQILKFLDQEFVIYKSAVANYLSKFNLQDVDGEDICTTLLYELYKQSSAKPNTIVYDFSKDVD